MTTTTNPTKDEEKEATGAISTTSASASARCCTKGVVYMAISIDGLIASKSGDVSFLDEFNAGGPSGKDDPLSFDSFLNSIDVIIMGRTTFEKVVSFGSPMWAYGTKPIIVQTSKSTNEFMTSLPNWITEKRISVTCSSKRPRKLMEHLFETNNYKRAYVDGGHTVRTFLKDKCISEMILTTVPLLLRQGIPLFLHSNNPPTENNKSSSRKSNRPPPVTSSLSQATKGYGDTSIMNVFMESQSQLNLDSSQSSNRSDSTPKMQQQHTDQQQSSPPIHPIRWKQCLTKSYPNGLVTTKYIISDDTAVAIGGEKDSSSKQSPATKVKLNIKTPDGRIQQIDVDLSSDTPETIVAKVEKETGIKMGGCDTTNAQFILLKYKDKEISKSSSSVDGDLKQYGIVADSTLVMEAITKLNVQAPDGKTHQIIVDLYHDTPDKIKEKITKQIGTTTMDNLDINKLLLKYENQELGGDGSGGSTTTLKDYGIVAGSTLVLNMPKNDKIYDNDPIIFVDIKTGTLFGTERSVVIEKGVLTLSDQNNKEEFVEATKHMASRDKILKLMLNSPSLGLATSMVIVKKDVDLEVNEAKEKAKNMWGVKLKHREQNKKGEEFIFVDLKTGACGELSRSKMIDINFITPVISAAGSGESLKESEKDPNVYDKYILELRKVFWIKFE